MDNFDVLQLPVGYAYHVKNRTNCDRKSGGIIVIYKQALAKHKNFLNSNSKFVNWFEIIKVLPIPNKILFGCVYIQYIRILKRNLKVKPTEVVDIKVWCNNRYGVLTCPNKLKAFKYPIHVVFFFN